MVLMCGRRDNSRFLELGRFVATDLGFGIRNPGFESRELGFGSKVLGFGSREQGSPGRDPDFVMSVIRTSLDVATPVVGTAAGNRPVAPRAEVR